MGWFTKKNKKDIVESAKTAKAKKSIRPEHIDKNRNLQAVPLEPAIGSHKENPCLAVTFAYLDTCTWMSLRLARRDSCMM